MGAIKYLLFFSLATNNLTYYGRRHFKLFTNRHVSWDTLYLPFNQGCKIKLDTLDALQCR